MARFPDFEPKGVIPACLLPFHDDFTIDEQAYRKHLRRVIVPDTLDASDADWITPFLMQISPIHSAAGAYQALTGRTIMSPTTRAAIYP